MHDDSREVLESVERLLRQRLRPAVHRRGVACEVAAFEVAGEPIPVQDALAARYARVGAGHRWGRPWGTTWLRVSGAVPRGDAAASAVLRVDLGFDARTPGFQAEGLVFDADGEPLKGVAPRNAEVPLSLLQASPGEQFVVFVEAASNPDVMGPEASFAPTALGDRSSVGAEPLYRLGAIDVAERDETVAALCWDVEVVAGLAHELPTTDPRRHELVRSLARAVRAVDPEAVSSTAARARAELAGVLASRATASAHRVVATGHAHIDCAWLWPVRETVRKCARTFANVLALAESEPDLVFACSQAQQYAWLRDHYPSLFERVARAVALGRIVPVGGTWVEPDGNLCGGESLVRQLVLGRRFFASAFGVECREVWLPDSFGYSAAWPQIARLAGAEHFLTQKLSWNQTNAFPHSTFLWEGIDGSRVFTHFPPVATYNAELTPAELARASRGYAEHGRGSVSLVPFGYGDGGGGPTRDMLERARRQRDLEGSPRVEIGSPDRFFSEAEQEYADPPVWSGELYLEIHRGTFTSQARLKAGNRRCEHLLREAELWSVTALVRVGLAYPYDAIERAWEKLLLLQFHDILPGSSIAWVNDEAAVAYDALAGDLIGLVDRALAVLAGDGTQTVAFNAGPRTVDGVPPLSAVVGTGRGTSPPPGVSAATARRDRDEVVLDNGLLRVVVGAHGTLVSVRDLVADREVLAPGGQGNLLQLHRDTPTRYDAWDLDASYREEVADLDGWDDLEVLSDGPAEAVVEVRRRFGDARASTVLQRVALRRGERCISCEAEVDWSEHEKILKVGFPLDLRAEHSSAEIQYGHVRRPVHVNTSWDAARFEIYAHRWIHVGEAGYGVAVANTATYGHDVTRATRPDGGTTTTVRLSLLRGARFPDPRAEVGRHRFSYVLVPGADIADAVEAGYRANLPLRLVRGATGATPVVTVEDARRSVVVECVKAADDRSGDVVVRCYESLGGRTRAVLRPGHDVARAFYADLLEQPLAGEPLERDESGGVLLELRPFQIVTVVLCRGA